MHPESLLVIMLTFVDPSFHDAKAATVPLQRIFAVFAGLEPYGMLDMIGGGGLQYAG